MTGSPLMASIHGLFPFIRSRLQTKAHVLYRAQSGQQGAEEGAAEARRGREETAAENRILMGTVHQLQEDCRLSKVACPIEPQLLLLHKLLRFSCRITADVHHWRGEPARHEDARACMIQRNRC